MLRVATSGSVDGRQLRAEITLAVANAGFILLMLVSGMVIPVSKLPWAVVRPVLAAKFFRWE